MKKIRIYGASDDLIEVEGDIQAEGSPRADQPGYVVLNTGDVFSFGMDPEGTWLVKHIVVSTPPLWVDMLKHPVSPEGYSEVAVIEGKFESLIILQSWPIDEEELQDLLEEALERSIVRGRCRLPRERMIAAIEAITGRPMMTVVKDTK